MQAKDIMTSNVVSVAPDTSVQDIAAVLLARHVSAVPVVDTSKHLVGIVSEGDLMRRAELGTERQRSWWLTMFTASEADRAKAFIKGHGRCAEDVMTRDVSTVSETTSIADIAHLLESRRVKRVPVVRDREVVGIVSRANLIQGLATAGATDEASDDDSIRKAFDKLVVDEDWMTHGCLNATVTAGTISVWGWADSEAECKAIKLAVEGIAGVKKVDMHIGLIAPYLRGA